MESGVCALPGVMKRAVSYQIEGKFTDLSMVHENLDIARLAAELLTA